MDVENEYPLVSPDAAPQELQSSKTATTTPNAASAAAPPLPLGWTRVQRKRTRTENMMEWCCEDPSCKRRSSRPTVDPDTTTTASSQTFQGTAVFLLHESNPEWFQGYFYYQGMSKPWGLLAVQVEIDDCLQCALGGYRELELTVLPFEGRDKQVLKNVQWTGGDMMRLNASMVQMEPTKLLTDQKAVPTVERVFGSLLTKLRDDDDDQTSVLELFPDVAVVTGTMKLTLTVDDSKMDDD